MKKDHQKCIGHGDPSRHLIAILENTSDLVATAQFDGTITYLNKVGCVLLGIANDCNLSKKKIAAVIGGNT